MPRLEGPYLVIINRSPTTPDEDPAKPDEVLRTYHISALRAYELPVSIDSGTVAPLRRRGRPKNSGGLARLPACPVAKVASLVRGILMNPDGTDPYTHLKTELINRSGESSQQEIRQLLSGEELEKRKRRRIDATCSLPQTSRRLFIRDRISNISFLVDTGSDVSLIPANTYQKRNSSQQTLFAANSSTINAYGQKALSLNFNLRRDFLWTFLIADVSIPILGADFLHYFELVPDLRNKCLRDAKTKLQSVGHLKYADLHSVQISISKDTIYHKLLKNFLLLLNCLPNPNQPVKHTTVHNIVTKGPQWWQNLKG
ncbi:hypothetical protein AVEN_2444-1 [Araneus ventricosus]|uniref:Peptidase A2 domain-containing protein n=1 Tax=Araneus ventricosus TaxID=182803 RepID=A0A4Y2PIQ8_ARAVE|nr:hypothetical protein AVEN_2444-1 [Araneus ventricosus]